MAGGIEPTLVRVCEGGEVRRNEHFIRLMNLLF